MGRFASFLTASLAFTGAYAAVLDLIPSNFDDVVLKSGKPALVEFFAPWCGHCKTLAPVYAELGEAFASLSDKVTIAKVDADAERALGQRFGVQGFPTLKWFDGKSATPEDYKGGRDLESLTKFVQEKTGVSAGGAKAKRAEKSHVEFLNDATFKQKVGGDQDVIVAFTAPWCGHCKTLAPIFEKVGEDFARESSVLIAKVDCEAENAKAIAADAGVRSYPTINFYPAGSTTAEAYNGGRTEADFVKFLNEKAGLHRAVGGGYDALAGTLPALDELVKGLSAGGASAYKEFAKRAGALADGAAAYYAKVAGKAEANAEYAGKELKRVKGLIAKGGLAPEKLDDLVKRSNVLAKFVGGEEGKSEL